MLCGVKFCGGCNPRYDRGKAFELLRRRFADESIEPGKEERDQRAEALSFDFAKEGVPYDALLVIGGCPACCASHEQYTVNGPVLKLWAPEHLDEIAAQLKRNAIQ